MTSFKIRRTIDGGYTRPDTRQLVALVKEAYLRTALIPSRGVWGYSRHYASAAGALAKAFRWPISDFLPGTPREWQDGFIEGFEYTKGAEPWDALLPGEYRLGFLEGRRVAEEIFNWPDAPDIHSEPRTGH